MKYDEKYGINHDQWYEPLQSLQFLLRPGTCWICKRVQTHYVDIDCGDFVCSEECTNKMVENMEACA
jgi:hypothetical protein